MGRLSGVGKFGYTCIDWRSQHRKVDSSFPDGSRSAARHYCRNPDNDDRPWCYYNAAHEFDYCAISYCRTYSTTTMTQLHITG